MDNIQRAGPYWEINQGDAGPRCNVEGSWNDLFHNNDQIAVHYPVYYMATY